MGEQHRVVSNHPEFARACGLLGAAPFGFAQRSHGATRYALDKKARQLLAEVVSPDALRRTGSLDIVAVFSDEGALVTASHRTGRLRRDVTRH